MNESVSSSGARPDAPERRDVAIRHLRAFLAVADTLNFTQAAELTGTTQPSLTRTIRRLEEALGTRLLHRTTRTVALSPAGDRLRAELLHLLPRLEDALAARPAETRLRLGFTWMLPDGWMQDALSSFEEQTGAGVELVRRDEPFAGVDRGVVDLALLRGDAPASGMHTVLLCTEAQVAAAARGTALARQQSVRWIELADHPLVRNVVSGTVRPELWPAARRPRTAVACGNFDEWLEAVAAGRGVGIVPESAARRGLHPSVRFLRIPDAPSVPMLLAYPTQGAHPLAARFAALVQDSFAATVTRTVTRPVAGPATRTVADAARLHPRPGALPVR
ncbi:LysR family transcriptional regulator [Streptomyces rubellomurinus]|uniref:LysR family transcriptional regulator n=1 Tax=Streptomyces sp. Y1 TaxID=3238634 RepID=A0AB39TLJ5_9ACTN